MRKKILLAALLCGVTLFAQDDEVHFADELEVEVFNHEAKIGASMLYRQLSIDLSYEYLNSETFTFGLYASKGLEPFEGNTTRFTEDFALTPFARFYLGFDLESKADGTYVEAFSRFMFGETELYDFDLGGDYTEKANKTGVGLGIGKKFLSDAFVIDGVVGAGYMLNDSEFDEYDRLFIKLNVLIGYRF